VSGEVTVTLSEVEALAAQALRASKVSAPNAAAVARSIAAAERDGQQIVGLSYLPLTAIMLLVEKLMAMRHQHCRSSHRPASGSMRALALLIRRCPWACRL
jgi:LDH2 family malate/lactate/ureidoglycolate dehydrogenase